MNDTPFNFQKDHPELYEQVQENKKRESCVKVRSILSTMIVNLMVLGVLEREGVSFGSTLFILAVVSFFAAYTFRGLCERFIK